MIFGVEVLRWTFCATQNDALMQQAIATGCWDLRLNSLRRKCPAMERESLPFGLAQPLFHCFTHVPSTKPKGSWLGPLSYMRPYVPSLSIMGKAQARPKLTSLQVDNHFRTLKKLTCERCHFRSLPNTKTKSLQNTEHPERRKGCKTRPVKKITSERRRPSPGSLPYAGRRPSPGVQNLVVLGRVGGGA